MPTILVKVKPGARVSALEGPGDDGTYRAQLKSQPVAGKANEELLGLIAARFGCARADVALKTGASSRVKRVVIDV